MNNNYGFIGALFASSILQFVPAYAQSAVIGNTFVYSNKYYIEVCRPSIGKCQNTPETVDNGNVYVSTKGRIFDYTKGRAGSVYQTGKSYTMPGIPGVSGWLIQGNSLIFTSESDLTQLKIVYNTSGAGGCAIQTISTSKHRELTYQAHVISSECSLRTGNSER